MVATEIIPGETGGAFVQEPFIPTEKEKKATPEELVEIIGRVGGGGAIRPPSKPTKPIPPSGAGISEEQRLAAERLERAEANKRFLEERLAVQKAEAQRLASLSAAQRLAERRARQDQQIRFQEELVTASRIKKRDLTLKEREDIARKVFKEQQPKIIKLKAGERAKPIIQPTEQFLPGATLKPRPQFFAKTGEGAAIFISKFTQDLSRPDFPDFPRQTTIKDIGLTKAPKVSIQEIIQEEIRIEREMPKEEFTLDPKLLDIRTTPERTSTRRDIKLKFEEPPVFVSRRPTELEILREASFTETARDQVTFGGAIGGFAAGVGFSVIGTGRLAKGLVTQPVETTGQLIEGLIGLPSKLPELAILLKTEPAFVSGFLTSEILQAVAVGKGLDFTFRRKTTIKKLRDVQTPEFIEKQLFAVSRGREFKVSEFRITGELKPPRVKITTTGLRELVGIKPISKEFISPQKFVIETIKPVIGQFPFRVVEARTKSNILRFTDIAGESRLITSRTAQLLNIDELLLKRFVESKTGIPASLETARKFAKRGTDFELSDIAITKASKFDIKTKKTTFIGDDIIKTLDFKDFRIRFGDEKTFAEVGFGKIKLQAGKGKTTELSRALTRTKELLETEEFAVFTSKTFFKDVTKPFPRAVGKTQKLKGTIFVKKEPIILDVDTGVKFVTPADIKKTPLSKTFQELQQIEQLQKILPKIKPTKEVTKGIPITTAESVVQKTTIPSVKIIQDEIAEIPITKQTAIVFEGRIPLDLSLEKTITGQVSTTDLISKELSKEASKTLEKQISKTLSKTLAKELTKEATKTLTLLKQPQKLAQKQTLKTLLKLKTLPKTKTIPLPIPTITTKLTDPFPILDIDKKRRIRIIPLDEEGFDTFVKKPKQDKFSKINIKAHTKSDSEDFLAKVLDTSTARSGFIKPSKNKPEPLDFDVIPGYFEGNIDKFRPFKIRKGVKIPIDGIIEKSAFIGDTIEEIQELSFFRRVAQLKKKERVDDLLSDIDIDSSSSNSKKKTKTKSKSAIDLIRNL